MPLLLFLAALEYRTLAEPEIDMSSLMDDVSKENEYIPVPSPERTDMAAAAHAKPKKPDTQQLKVVDHKTPVNRLDNIAQSRNESEEGDVYLYQFVEHENDEFDLINIEDDDEY